MWLIGDAVRGGQVYGEWLGLNDAALYKNRDLPVTTDFRDILSPILQQHLSVPSDRLKQIFPNYQVANNIDFLV